jgi:hypothetical protein
MDHNEIEWYDVELVPRQVRTHRQQNIAGIIAVSRRPFVFDAVKLAQLKQKALDPEIKLLLDKNVFSYIKLPVNIRPRDEVDVRFLSIEVVLASENKGAICWSMEPTRIEEEVKLKTESVLSGSLKLKDLELGTSDSLAQEFILYQPNIEAFGIGRENPAWEFTPTKGRKLSGIYILHMVVLVPKNTLAAGKVVIKADIFKEGLLWNYHVQRKEDSEDVLTIALPGFTY